MQTFFSLESYVKSDICHNNPLGAKWHDTIHHVDITQTLKDCRKITHLNIFKSLLKQMYYKDLTFHIV